MMTVKKIQVVENSPVVVLGRFLDADALPIQQSATSAVDVRVFDTVTGTETGAYNFAPEDAISDTLRTDRGWNEDMEGWNLACQISGAAFPTGGRTYQIEVKVTPTEGEAAYGVWIAQATDIFSE
jgi:hypothetical protein